MSSLLQFYSTSKTESQKDGYLNYFDYSLVKVDGDYVPSWYFEESDTNTRTVYLEELAAKALYNGEIDVVSSTDITTGGYTTSQNTTKNLIYADKQVETLTGIHRLKISIASSPATLYYSDIFYNINNDLPIYIRTYNLEYIRVYRY
jgi:hypothetical protein